MSDSLSLPARKPTRLKAFDYSSANRYFITICTHGHKELLWAPSSSADYKLNYAGVMVRDWLFKIEETYGCWIDTWTVMPNHVHAILVIEDPNTPVAGGHTGPPLRGDLRIEKPKTTVPVGDAPCGVPNVGINTRQDALYKNQTTPVAGGHMGPPLRGDLGFEKPKTNVPVGDDAPCGVPNAVCGNKKHGSIPQIMGWYKTMTTNTYIHGVKSYGWPKFDGKLWQRSFWDHIIRSEKTLDNIRDYISNNQGKWDIDVENRKNNEDREKYYKKLFSKEYWGCKTGIIKIAE
jgi:REP element-mobilizing transposase RayT